MMTRVNSRARTLLQFGRRRRASVVVLGREIDARRLFDGARTITSAELDDSGNLRGLHDIVVLGGVTPQPSGAWLKRLLSRVGYAVLVEPHGAALGTLPDPVIERILFQVPDVSCSGGQSSRVNLLRGDLAEPRLRVDDYPTGVRPIASDLGPLHDVIRSIDAAGAPFHLGIVPALLNSEMQQFLRSLTHLVPVVHGYDHAYPEKSALLIERRDPGNARSTVGAFNEFAGQSTTEIVRKLRIARSILEDTLGTAVTGYIPPCNRADRTTGQALVELGYSHYFSERRIPGCPLPHFASSFYGKSSELRPGHLSGTVCLHATWEVDVQKLEDRTSLPRFLRQLLSERAAHEAELTRELNGRLRETDSRGLQTF